MRFSGKKSGKRVRLVCRVSTSVSAKSVLTVSEASAFAPSRWVTSRLGSSVPSVERVRRRVRRSRPPAPGARSRPRPRSKSGRPVSEARPARLEAPCSPGAGSPSGSVSCRRWTRRCDVEAPVAGVALEAAGSAIGMRISAVQPRASRAVRGLPLAVPVRVDVLAARLHQRVVARAPGVDREDVAGAAVLERVEHDHDVVLALEVAVALLGEAHDPRGSGSSQRMPKTRPFGPGQHLHDRAAGRRGPPCARLDHHQVRRWRRGGATRARRGAVEFSRAPDSRPAISRGSVEVLGGSVTPSGDERKGRQAQKTARCRTHPGEQARPFRRVGCEKPHGPRQCVTILRSSNRVTESAFVQSPILPASGKVVSSTS